MLCEFIIGWHKPSLWKYWVELNGRVLDGCETRIRLEKIAFSCWRDPVIRRRIDTLRQAGVEVAYRQHDVHLRDLDGVRSAFLAAMEERRREQQQAQASVPPANRKPVSG